MASEDPAAGEIPVGTRVHVWWPACESPIEEMGAAFYPAEMRAPATGSAAADGDFVLQFARGEFVVSAECVFPVENPIAFGGETFPIRAGELVEVSNASTTDPCAWLVRVVAVSEGSLVVEFPFDGRKSRRFSATRVRRPRFYEQATDAWSLFQPFQTWDHGMISSPIELEFVFEGEYFDYLTAHEPEYQAALALIGSASPGTSAAADMVPAVDGHAIAIASGDGLGAASGAINLLHRGNHAPRPGDVDDLAAGPRHSASMGGKRPRAIDHGGAVVLPPPHRLRSHEGADHSNAHETSAHDLTMHIPLPAPLQIPPHASFPAGPGPVDMVTMPAPNAAVPLPDAQPDRNGGQASAGAEADGQHPPACSAQPLLMWVRPLMHRSGDSMLFEMRPAQDLPPGCWAQAMAANSWGSIDSETSAVAAKQPKGAKACRSAPKKALNPYLVYLRRHEPHVRAENPSKTNTQITHILAKMWKNVSDEERAECKAVADVDKRRYVEELNKWRHEHPEAVEAVKPRVASKRGVNGYVLFMKDFQDRTLQRKGGGTADVDLASTEEQKLLEAHGQDLNAAISAAWKALPEATKREYKAKANAKKLTAPAFRVTTAVPRPFGPLSVPVAGIPSQNIPIADAGIVNGEASHIGHSMPGEGS